MVEAGPQHGRILQKIHMTAKRKKQDIPVDEDGLVPFKAIVCRYQQVGRDNTSHANQKVLPSRVTRDEIADWWDDPTCCDIEGVDTPDAPIYSVPISIKGRKRRALGKIAVIAPTKEANRIRRTMAEHFTEDELELLADGCSLVISTVPHLDDCTGYYLRKQNGIPVPEIVLEEGSSVGDAVHEFIHALRVEDGRTSYPTKDGELIPGYDRLPKKVRKAIESREEKETVVETVARTTPDPIESGYYGRIPGADSRAAYLQDQLIVSGSRALKGKAAIRAAEKNYDRTTISRAIICANAKKRGRNRCSGGGTAGSPSTRRRIPRAHRPRSGTSTSTSARPGYSSTATRGRSTPVASRWEGTFSGAIWRTRWITWSCTARRQRCPRSRSRSATST